MTGKRGGAIKMAKTPIINGPKPGAGSRAAKAKGKTQIKNGYVMGTPVGKVRKVK